jgi:acetyl-CoA carboxylase beta subunit
MSWLEKLLPPKIQHTDPSDRRSVPEGVWVKCPSCRDGSLQERFGTKPKRMPKL